MTNVFGSCINDLADVRKMIDRTEEALNRLELNLGPTVKACATPGESWWTLTITYRLQDGSRGTYTQDFNTLEDLRNVADIFSAAGLITLGKEV